MANFDSFGILIYAIIQTSTIGFIKRARLGLGGVDTALSIILSACVVYITISTSSVLISTKYLILSVKYSIIS